MTIPKSSTSIPMLTEIVLPGLVELERLIIHKRPVPTPGKGQALVEMLATGVSFAEQQMRRGRYAGVPKFPYVLGYDLVCVVVAVGPQVDESLVGVRVAAVVKTGAWTTHALVDAGHLVPVPDSLDAAAAETVVVNGITAWQMLKKAKVHSGQTILIHGANGGVGNTLVQLARHLSCQSTWFSRSSRSTGCTSTSTSPSCSTAAGSRRSSSATAGISTRRRC
jgi:NADPH:quinone reductase-like Zn-dependent oxidoreductase